MLFAMLRRRPRSGRTSSCASASIRGGGGACAGASVLCSACASRSAFITLPCGPDPCSAPRSTPSSRAIRRVTGVASTRRPSPLPAGRAALVCAPCALAPACGCGTLAVCSGAGCPACSGETLGAAWAGTPVLGAAFAAGPPSTSSTTSVACTLTISPSYPIVSSTLPRRGLGMVTVALSVITSRSGWSSTISSPAFTSHLTISPSTTPSPMSGSLNSKRAMSGLIRFQLAQRLRDPRRERQVIVFQRVRERRVPAGDPQDRGLQRGEAPLLHERADLGREPTGARRLLHDRAAPRLPHAARHRLHVQRPERAQIDQLGVERRLLLDRLQRLVEHRAPGDHRHPRPLADDLRFSDRHRVVAFGHLAARGAIDALRLHEDHRIVLADGGEEQPFRVDGVRGADHL